ncbi:MAG: molybdopterin molybdotransferase MoeA [Chitinophagaceae bacterium]|nr:molybdopterin molybdotransferase MoeA [Chitinophagaceae bacterium]
MISVADALQLILQNTEPLEAIRIRTDGALDYAISEDVCSEIDFPSFRQSAMDGYAIRYEDYEKGVPIILVAETQAGNVHAFNLSSGQAIRIFTGAMVPEGADTVVMQERVTQSDTHLLIEPHELQMGANIRPVASQCHKGEKVMQKGDRLSPGASAFLTGLGMEWVPVCRKPVIRIINTGKELMPAGSDLQPGQIYESNSVALIQALQSMSLKVDRVRMVDDDVQLLQQAIAEELEQCDVLLLTGGVSVGDYDFVIPAAQANGIETIFHKIRQKPGKPLYFGKKDKKYIVGLPGNPGSVMTCFYMYVVPVMRRLMGYQEITMPHYYLPSLQPIKKKGSLTHFLKAKLYPDGVYILDHQESYKMNAFARANALIEIPEEKNSTEKGELVKVYLLYT